MFPNKILFLLVGSFFFIGANIIFIIIFVKILLYVTRIRTKFWEEAKDYLGSLPHRNLNAIVNDLANKKKVNRKNYNMSFSQVTIDTNLNNEIRNGFSILILYDHNVDRKVLVGKILSNFFIDNNTVIFDRDYINYICGCEPAFIINDYLKDFVKNNTINTEPNIRCFSNKIYYIDAYYQNFSFRESLFRKRTRVLNERDTYNIIKAKNLGNIHSATVESYGKILDSIEDTSGRPPLCVIYDTLSSLKDTCETEHIIPYFTHCLVAEKQYKMITLILERINANEEYVKTLKYLADAVIEYTVDEKGILNGKLHKKV